MTYPVTVTVTYPERVSGSGETGEAHTVYKFVSITKRSTRLQVNTYQYMITIRDRKRKAKLLGKPYDYIYYAICYTHMTYPVILLYAFLLP